VSAPPLSPRGRVLSDVDDERGRQDGKWGEQNHRDGTYVHELPLQAIFDHLPDGRRMEHATAAELRRAARAACQAAAAESRPTWLLILLEEVFEASAESRPAPLRTELVQVAAVATQWAEAIDRREAGR